MNILGVSAFYCDSAACLIKDGKIIAAAQEERFTRKKYDSSFPINAINYCLSEGKIRAEDLDYISFYDKPFLTFKGILQAYLNSAPRGASSFAKTVSLWVRKKLWAEKIIRKELNYKGKILFTQHQQSRAASAFFASPFKKAAFLIVDSGGELLRASFGIGEINRVKISSETKFPHSLGLLYSAFTHYIGFKVNSGEYKMMGLASYGEPKYKDLILRELLDLREDGSFKINMKYFNCYPGFIITNKKFNRLFGGSSRKDGDKLTQRYIDIACSIQSVTEEVMLRMVRFIQKETGERNLCLAGGMALNCVCNGRILREGPFDRIWIQPAAGEAGGALGAALFAWYQYLGNKRVTDERKDFMGAGYLGPEFDKNYILKFLKDRNIAFSELDQEEIPEKISDLIASGEIVGWFQGRMEFGPRGLGNRSILGDARSSKIRERINSKVKFRESFRPFAPSVLKEEANKFFDISVESPYMLLAAPVKEDRRKELSEKERNLLGLEKLQVIRSQIPAVTHVDYSARVQTVNREDNQLYYDMIASFSRKYGCPVVINTSFNLREEPIVCTPEDAYLCFMRSDMDYLLLGNFLLKKKEQKGLDFNPDYD